MKIKMQKDKRAFTQHYVYMHGDIPLYMGGIVGTTLKVDSKGRICLPPELRDEVGDVVIIERTPEGLLILPGEKVDFVEMFKRMIASEPPRTGDPENWPPMRMKEIWSSRG